MEIFVDFGLFELVAAVVLARLGRALYARRSTMVLVIAASIGGPLVLLFLVEEGAPRWLAALVVATAILNVSLIVESVRGGGARRAGGVSAGPPGAGQPRAGEPFGKDASRSRSMRL